MTRFLSPLLLVTFFASAVASTACGGSGGTGGGGSGGAGGTGGTGGTAGTGGGGTGGTGGAACNPGPSEDHDGDGWTGADGDCNDCDPNVNPGAVEVIVNTPDAMGNIPPPIDEDCNGVKDDIDPPCDDLLALDDLDPLHGAQAIELCRLSTSDQEWGVVSAAYTRADGTPINPMQAVGLLDDFGPNVQPLGGQRMLGLSSGYARRPFDACACGNAYCNHTDNFANPACAIGLANPGVSPDGDPVHFPQSVPGCPSNSETTPIALNDDVALSIRLRPPSNATGYKFLFKFHSFEFGEYVCTQYNDQFVAFVQPPPMGSIFGNVSFDANDNPVSVNIAYFDVCDPLNTFADNCKLQMMYPCPDAPQPYCPAGSAELVGNGFDGVWDGSQPLGEDAGATSWLETRVPLAVDADGTFELRFAIWDVGDSSYDSTVLVDKFEWIANGGTVDIGTGQTN